MTHNLTTEELAQTIALVAKIFTFRMGPEELPLLLQEPALISFGMEKIFRDHPDMLIEAGKKSAAKIAQEVKA